MAAERFKISPYKSLERRDNEHCYIFPIYYSGKEFDYSIVVFEITRVSDVDITVERFKESLNRHIFRQIRYNLAEGRTYDLELRLSAWRICREMPGKDCEYKNGIPGAWHCRIADVDSDALYGYVDQSICEGCLLPEVWIRCDNLMVLATLSNDAYSKRHVKSLCAHGEANFRSYDLEACWQLPCFEPSEIEVEMSHKGDLGFLRDWG